MTASGKCTMLQGIPSTPARLGVEGRGLELASLRHRPRKYSDNSLEERILEGLVPCLTTAMGFHPRGTCTSCLSTCHLMRQCRGVPRRSPCGSKGPASAVMGLVESQGQRSRFVHIAEGRERYGRFFTQLSRMGISGASNNTGLFKETVLCTKDTVHNVN